MEQERKNDIIQKNLNKIKEYSDEIKKCSTVISSIKKEKRERRLILNTYHKICDKYSQCLRDLINSELFKLEKLGYIFEDNSLKILKKYVEDDDGKRVRKEIYVDVVKFQDGKCLASKRDLFGLFTKCTSFNKNQTVEFKLNDDFSITLPIVSKKLLALLFYDGSFKIFANEIMKKLGLLFKDEDCCDQKMFDFWVNEDENTPLEVSLSKMVDI